MNFFLDRKNGKISLTRVMSFMVVITILALLVAWNIIAMIKGGTIVSIGANEVYA